MRREGEAASAKQEWVAIQTTAVKTSTGLSKELLDSQKIFVAPGARLHAFLTGDDGSHWLVREVSVDGVPIAGARYIFKNHWILKASNEQSASAVSRQEIVASVLTNHALARVRRRRLHAAFRRRLVRPVIPMKADQNRG